MCHSFILFFTASSILTAIMEAVFYKQPNKIHLLSQLITKRLETLNLRYLGRMLHKLGEDEKSKHMDTASHLLLFAAAQQSV